MSDKQEHGTGRWAKKHGARALARHLKNQSLDGRTRPAKMLAEIGDALAADRGGWGNVTAGERLLIEFIGTEAIFLRTVAAWAFRQPEIVVNDGDGPRLLGPLQKGFTSHLSALTRALGVLGIHPDKVERLPSLEAYLSARNGAATQANGTGQPDAPTNDAEHASEAAAQPEEQS